MKVRESACSPTSTPAGRIDSPPGFRTGGPDGDRVQGASGDPRARDRRKPRSSLRLPGSFALRYAARTLRAWSFQEPPRMTRFVP